MQDKAVLAVLTRRIAEVSGTTGLGMGKAMFPKRH